MKTWLRLVLRLVIPIVAALTLIFPPISPALAAPGSWANGPNLSAFRGAHAGVVLSDGKVLLAGGYASGYLNTSDIYDPTNNTWSSGGLMSQSRHNLTMTLLLTGKVLVAAGFNGSYVGQAELFDPATRQWSSAGSLATARTGATATLLNNGNVLVAGGSGGSILASAEIYRTASNDWTNAATMPGARYDHAAVRLNNGNVLIIGGKDGAHVALNTTVIYFPDGSFAMAGPNMATTRSTGHSATLLPDGKVLVAGGFTNSTTLASAELYNPVTGTFSAAASLNQARHGHTATLLADGTVMVVGGNVGGSPIATAEIYSPSANTWTTIGSMASVRTSHTTFKLQNSKVLVAGGYSAPSQSVALNSSEVYTLSSSYPVKAWSKYYNGLGVNYDHVEDMVVDGSGNIYVGGGSWNATGYDYAVVKYSPAGTQQWVARYNGPGNGEDYNYDLAVDGSGNIYTTGWSIGTGPSADKNDYLTIKYDPNGNGLWSARYDGVQGAGGDRAYRVGVDAAGNVYVTGWSRSAANGDDYVTVKYNSSGGFQWAVSYDGPAHGYEAPRDMVVDAAGNVYVTGFSPGVGTGEDWATVKYNASGAQQWVARYSGPGNGQDWPLRIALDASGNAYVTGFITNGTQKDLAVLKYNGSTGAQVWAKTYDGSGAEDRGTAIAVDSSGTVYSAGYATFAGTGADYVVFKYDGAGNQVWVSRYNNTGVNGADSAADIAVDSSGTIYVTGTSYGGGGYSTGNDFATLAYNSSGVQQWVIRDAAGNGNTPEVAKRLALFGSNLYVAGDTAYSDFYTVKYALSELNPPGLALITPNGGNFLRGTAEVRFNVSQAQGRPVTISMYLNDTAVSFGGGNVVTPPAGGAPMEVSRTFNTALYANAKEAYRLRIVATPQDNPAIFAQVTSAAAFSIDNTAPIINIPSGEKVPVLDLLDPTGTPFTFHVTAVDSMDPNPTLTSTGLQTRYLPGSTVVTFTATDWAGNQSIATATVTVNKARTTTSMASSTNPANPGQPVAFTAVVASPIGVPGGSVRFDDGGAALGTVALDATGRALFSTSSLAGGDHSITANYLGSAIYGVSTSPVLVQHINTDVLAPITSLSLDPQPNPNGWYNVDVHVTLSAADEPGGSGLARTEYSTNGGTTWTTYAAPFDLNTEGTTTVYYRSIDNGGNVETAKTQTVNIDRTAPSIIPPTDVTKEATGVLTDVAIGSASAQDNVEVASIFNDAPGAFPVGTTTVIWTARDVAGNAAAAAQNVTVTKRPVTVTTDIVSKVYGAADPALSYRITSGSLLTGDGFSGSLAREAGENAGAYVIQKGTLALPAYYELTFTGASLTITPRPITITAEAKSKMYGNSDPALTYQVTSGSLVNGDSFSGSLTRAPGENAGTYAIQQGTVALSGNYLLSYIGADLTIGKAEQSVTFGPIGDKTYGDPPFSLSATASSGLPVSFGVLSGSATISGNTVTITGAGTVTVRASQAGDANYSPAPNIDRSFTVNKANPVITWSNPADIVFGTPLGDAQLNASASVPGAFAYSPTAGTVLNAGSGQTLSVAFTPNDAANFNAASKSVSINVIKATPVITRNNPADIVYGTPLSTTQLNATASVPGTFAYTPAAATVLNAGSGQTLSVAFTPNDATNFNAAAKGVVINVIKATPVITWNNPADIVYGTPLSTAQLNATASVPGTFTYTPPSGTILNAGSNQNLHVDFAPADPVNYLSASADVTIKVSKATPVLAWSNPADTVYGIALSGTQLNATASVAGTFAYSPVAGTILNAGSGQTLSVAFIPNDAANYNNASASVLITVAQRPVTVTADAKVKMYGNADPALTYQITSGSLVNGDSFSGSLTRASGENAGTYAIQQGTMALSGNYLLSYIGADLTINPKTASVTPIPATKVYGSPDPMLTGALSGFSPDDGVTASYVRTAGEAAGDHTISATLSPAAVLANYIITYNTAAFTITKKTASVTPTTAAKTYGDADPVLTGVLSDFLPGDSVTASFSRTAGETVGEYVISTTLSPAGVLANYAITYNTSILTITPRSITVTADARSKAYGNVDPALTYQITSGSLVNGDSFSGSLTRVVGETVGTYAIQQGTVAISGNYVLTYVGADLTITPRPITITADAEMKVYGEADPALTYQVTGGSLANGDSFTGALSRVTGENVGTYAIQQGTLALSINYSLTYVGADLTITPLAITGSVAVASKVYDGTTAATITGRSLAGVVNGDDVSLSGGTAAFADKNAGNGKTVTVTGLSLSGTKAANYTVDSTTTAAADITPRPITITADAKTKVYGEADPALTYQVTSGSLVNGDSFSGSLTRAAGENVGSYAIEQGTVALGSNYTLTYVGADLTISKKTASVIPNAASKVYGAADPALSGTLSDFLAADGVSATYSRTAGENPGNYTISAALSPEGVLGNYNITYNTAVFTIGYSFKGLLEPYAAPPKDFNAGRSIPVKWQYINASGSVVDSSSAAPSITITLGGNSITADEAGKSGLQYDAKTNTWQFNWQTNGLATGTYQITITVAQTGQKNGPFAIQLR